MEVGDAGKNAPEAGDGLAYRDAGWTEGQLAQAAFMVSHALLEHGDHLANFPFAFEVAEEKDGIGEVADVDFGVQVADQTLLGENQEADDSPLIEVGEQLVEVQGEIALAGHAARTRGETDPAMAAHLAVARFFAENIATGASGLERTVTQGAGSVHAAELALAS